MSWPLEPLQRILCASDGSETSLQAAEAAVALAARTGAEVVFVHVIDDELLRDMGSALPDGTQDARARLEGKGEQILLQLRERAEARAVPCLTRLEQGDPPRTIDEVARELHADAIVVGKIGRHGVRKWLVGSVTRRLIESTQIPVVVIPRFAP
jgi:nucleotide-binding universal stress UspA family protein